MSEKAGTEIALMDETGNVPRGYAIGPAATRLRPRAALAVSQRRGMRFPRPA